MNFEGATFLYLTHEAASVFDMSEKEDTIMMSWVPIESLPQAKSLKIDARASTTFLISAIHPENYDRLFQSQPIISPCVSRAQSAGVTKSHSPSISLYLRPAAKSIKEIVGRHIAILVSRFTRRSLAPARARAVERAKEQRTA